MVLYRIKYNPICDMICLTSSCLSFKRASPPTLLLNPYFQFR